MKITRDWNVLIPTLQDTWISNVAGPLDIALTTGSDSLLISYVSFLWPDFVEHDDMILMGDHSDGLDEAVRDWLQTSKGDKSAVESMLNHRHLIDIHDPTRTPLEIQLRFIGRTCIEMWRLKLASDFPNRKFEFFFNDEAGLELRQYQVGFCSKRKQT